MLGISRRNLVYSFLLWTVVAVFTSTQLYLKTIQGGGDVTWASFLKIQLLVWWLWGLISPFIFWLGQRYPINRGSWIRNLAIHLPTAAIIVLMYLIAYALIWNLDQGSVSLASLQQWTVILFLNLFHWHFFIYVAIIGFVHARLFYEELKLRELRSISLENELLVSKLNFLKMQIQPHFLFNTLNGVVSAIQQGKSEMASNMTTELSELLRISLAQSEHQWTTLRNELHYVQAYLNIEKHRFKTLDVKYQIDQELMEAEVPNFILQPLVENAIKHGISRQEAANALEIAVKENGESLDIRIYNDGPKFIPSSDGIGLQNVKQRLKSLYGSMAKFVIEPYRQGTLVSISLPAA